VRRMNRGPKSLKLTMLPNPYLVTLTRRRSKALNTTQTLFELQYSRTLRVPLESQSEHARTEARNFIDISFVLQMSILDWATALLGAW